PGRLWRHGGSEGGAESIEARQVVAVQHQRAMHAARAHSLIDRHADNLLVRELLLFHAGKAVPGNHQRSLEAFPLAASRRQWWTAHLLRRSLCPIFLRPLTRMLLAVSGIQVVWQSSA